MRELLIGVHDLKDSVEELVSAWTGLAIFRAVLLALPDPEGSGKLYTFVYRFLHAIGLSYDKLRRNNA